MKAIGAVAFIYGVRHNRLIISYRLDSLPKRFSTPRLRNADLDAFVSDDYGKKSFSVKSSTKQLVIDSLVQMSKTLQNVIDSVNK